MTEAGRELGVVEQVIANPANDLWVAVDAEAGVETLIPALKDLLIEVGPRREDDPGPRRARPHRPGAGARRTDPAHTSAIFARPDTFLSTKRFPARSTSPRFWKSEKDPRDVLATPTAQARQVGVRDPRDLRSVGGELGEGRGSHLQEALGDAALQVEEQEVVGERLMFVDLPGKRGEHLASRGGLAGDEVDEP